MLFKVENTGRGARTVPTISGRSSVESGEKNARKLDMDPEVARQYIAMAQRSEKFSIKVSALDDAGRDELSKPLQPRQPRRMPPGYATPQQQSKVKSIPSQVASPYEQTSLELIEEEDRSDDEAGSSNDSAKAELLSRSDDMDLGALRAEIQMLIGKDWPRNGNKLSREKLKALLAE